MNSLHPMPSPDRDRSHRVTLMRGRDPHEEHRAASPLELLFDLTFVVAFGVAGNELAHAVAADHVLPGLFAFGVAMFAVVWAWINYSWFASAYDTDDVVYRLLTMVQMVGVVLMAIGLPRYFEGAMHPEHIDIGLPVLGYVIMRVALITQWLRAARQDPDHRRTCLTYAGTLAVAQVGWVVLAFVHVALPWLLIVGGLLILIELSGPVLAETRHESTPWHPHHIAERYGLLAIITLGEGVIGTLAALGAAVGPQGVLTGGAAVVVVAGMVLTFGLWWVYFSVEHGDWLHARPEQSFGFGYGHVPLVAGIAAVGAGLHVVGYRLDGEAYVSDLAVILAVVIPVAVVIGTVFAMYTYYAPAADPFHLGVIVVTALVLAAAAGVVAAGASVLVGLAVAALSPWPTVIGYEWFGYRHQAHQLEVARESATED